MMTGLATLVAVGMLGAMENTQAETPVDNKTNGDEGPIAVEPGASAVVPTLPDGGKVVATMTPDELEQWQAARKHAAALAQVHSRAARDSERASNAVSMAQARLNQAQGKAGRAAERVEEADQAFEAITREILRAHVMLKEGVKLTITDDGEFIETPAAAAG